MDADPNFRLKAFAVIAGILGVFLVVYVAQRCWYWLKTRRREDVDTSRVVPVIDFGLLAFGGIVIWLAIEALVLAVATQNLPVQPIANRKIAEIEIGKLDPDTNQLNLLFYPVDRAGRRLPEQRRPVLTSGSQFELELEIIEWRAALRWLGEGGFYQFLSLGGAGASPASPPDSVDLDALTVPRSLGAVIFLRSPKRWSLRQECREGEVFDIYLDPGANALSVQRQ